jgi:hypothetical protein
MLKKIFLRFFKKNPTSSIETQTPIEIPKMMLDFSEKPSDVGKCVSMNNAYLQTCRNAWYNYQMMRLMHKTSYLTGSITYDEFVEIDKKLVAKMESEKKFARDKFNSLNF